MSTAVTSREFFQAVLDASEFLNASNAEAAFGSNHMTAEDLRVFAESAISKLDVRNEARKSKPSKDSLESAARRQAVHEFFEAAGKSQLFDRDAVAEALGITPGQATAAMAALAQAEVLTRIGGKGKTKTVYQLA